MLSCELESVFEKVAACIGTTFIVFTTVILN